jgi:hypothetical protein
MNMVYLAVDSDSALAETENKIWKSTLGIGMVRVDTMTEGIKALQSSSYLYVGINSDVVDFMPLLKTMRSVTKTPIFIATSNYTYQKGSRRT